MEEESNSRGLLVFLTILVVVVMVAILIGSGINESDVAEEGSGLWYMIKRFFLYIRYLLLELIAFLFMQK